MKNVRGTYDYLPNEQLMRNKVMATLKEVFETYGFNPIETPILCMQEVLESKYAGGAEILKEVYTLTDQGERELALRYDLTVPFSRFIGMNKNRLNMPFKKYEIGKVFRNGPIKRGRKREFYQADVDVVGLKTDYAELEFFQMIDCIANKLGIHVVVKYNNREVLTEILKVLQVPLDNMASIILTIDKLEKMSEKDVLTELYSKGMEEENAIKLLELLRLDYKQILKIIESSSTLERFETFIQRVDKMEKSKSVNFTFTPSLARGLEVYTGTIWEVFIDDETSQVTSSIGAGGRYDKIIGQLLETEEEYPAVGMTFGVDVIMERLKETQVNTMESRVECLIIPMTGCELEALQFANGLRNKTLKVEVDFTGKKLKKSLARANKLNIPFVAVYGDDERTKGVIRIKDMKNGQEALFVQTDVKAIVESMRVAEC